MPQTALNVTFWNADTGKELANAPMPPASLPERLLAPRRIELSNQPYAVVSANPVTRTQAIASGKVDIYLRPLPNGLFTVPTLAEELPRFDPSARQSGRLLELDTDEWCQVEFYGASRAPRVAEQVARIALVRNEVGDNGFYPRMHIRGQMGALLKDVDLSVDAVVNALPPGTLELDGIVIEGESGRVKDGFAFLTISGLELYGVATQGKVKVLAARLPPEPTPLPVEAMGLSVLMLTHGLQLADWTNARTASCDAGEVEALLSTSASLLKH